MTLHDAFTVASLALTPATIIGSVAVVAMWWRTAVRSAKQRPMIEMNWFVIGVVLSFAGASVDNFYWGTAWLLSYLDHPFAPGWFDSGVYSNLPFRQALTTAAAFCHVRAAVETDSLIFRGLTAASALSFLLVVGALSWV